MAIFAQKDNPFKSAKLKLDWDQPTKSETKSNTVTLPYKSIFDKDDSYLKRYSILNKKQGEESVLVQKNEFKNPGEDIKRKLNNKDKEIKPEYRSNQFLGEFRVKTRYVKIVCRDHEYPDGDRVRLLLNEKTVIYEILLEAAPKEYYVDISDGFNKLDFVALNQGSSGPNTAAFSVFDDSGKLITSNEWNLTTGIKASIVVIKEEEQKKK
ncbi:hypothetical protein NAT47_11805 [Flavobacterium sp. HXWNR69]|uniref:Uncharacterized protein n=1 Tax=Flavobacterium fragile TaxID=2949085 RepID=A0ABT0TJC9_9FLAO|nr:hypothetical protein [Flavobacterium sp. HXWNR69]MCL9771100.1 hypothetical protein [Flavobacterium sp. HXWNR69]